MNICVPVTQDNGLESHVCAHFGSAPYFAIVDAESRVCRTISNANDHHAHGMCQPLLALAGQSIDGLVVGGIGAGALSRLQASGIRVYRADAATVAEAVDAFNSGALTEMTPASACTHHDHSHHEHGGSR